MNKFYRVLFLLAMGISTQGCHLYKIPKLAKQGEVTATDYFQKTPIEFYDNIIFIEVTIEGKPYNFIYDTGAELSVIGKHISQNMNYRVITSDQVKATRGKSAHKVEFVEIPKITIANIDFERTGAIISDISHFDQYFGCNSIDGIIGNNLLRKAAWQIDYKNQEIRFSDNARKFKISEAAHEIKMEAGKFRNVYLNATIDSIPLRFTFDTGSSSNLTADSSLFKLLLKKNPDLEYSSKSGIIATDLNGKVIGKSMNTLAENIEVEGLKIPDQIISLSGNSSYLMGNEIFKHFTLTIDWENDKLLLEPSTTFESDTLEQHQFNLSPNYLNRKIEIVNFNNDHPLEESISIDSEILTINGLDVTQFTLEDLCNYWQKNKNLLRETKDMEIKVVDNGKIKTINLTRKVLLPH